MSSILKQINKLINKYVGKKGKFFFTLKPQLYVYKEIIFAHITVVIASGKNHQCMSNSRWKFEGK